MNLPYLLRRSLCSSLCSSLVLGLALATSAPRLLAAGEGHHEHGHDHQHAAGAAGHGAAIGRPGQAKAVKRTIEVRMSDDMRFTPAEIQVRKGETIRLQVVNAGQMRHELVLGRLAELKEHAELMRKFPDMEHADPNAVTVEPGKTGELIWQFTRGGTVDFACLRPGHFEAGMKGQVAVAEWAKVATATTNPASAK